ncbi:carbohydrate ABC transporter permease [Actibacterium pelagium]|uniref:Sugar ABC transporter permease n=1 Tax=Actibacterium pelagium TaxID=2029103 RepID=A0A917AH36_9RHOB|nr:carbohydrate ABC transporter permease [Actibacterium pelagium]GGE51023.1 sugar ABC transporter permease [Actibacterium pelagium]
MRPRTTNGIVRPRTLQSSVLRGLLFLVLGLFCLYYLIPLIVMISTSLKSLTEIREGTLISLPREITFDAWSKAWESACVGVRCDGLKPFMWNSIAMAVPAVLLSTTLGAINGYALTKWRFPGANWIFALILFGAFIPFQVVLLPMARTLGQLGLAGTVPGLILVHTVYGLAFTTLFFRNFFIGVSDGIVKAAQIDGAGFFGIFFKIVLPMSIPAIVVTVIWQFTQIWNDFLFGVAFTIGDSNPVTVALNNVVNTSTGVKEYNVDMAAAIIAALPTMLVYVVAGAYFVRGLSAGSMKG